jgi:hypothetical protein
MTEEDIHINGKRVAMTERMMEEVLINELDNTAANHTGKSLKCKECSVTLKHKFLDNLRSELAVLIDIF